MTTIRERAGGGVAVFSIMAMSVLLAADVCLAWDVVGSALWAQPRAIAVAGGYAYCGFDHGLLIVDVTDPSRPQVKARLLMPGGDVSDVDLQDGIAYLTFRDEGVHAVRVTDPASPLPLGASGGLVGATRACVAADRLYVAAQDHGLYVLDLTDPMNPSLRSRCPLPGSAKDVAAAGDCAVVAAGEARVLVVDVSDALAPRLVGRVQDYRGMAEAVAVRDSLAYVSTFAGLLIADVSDARRPELLAALTTDRYTEDVAVSGDTVFLATHGDSLLAVDVRDSRAPVVSGYVPVDGGFGRIAAAPTGLAVATPRGGLQLYVPGGPFDYRPAGAYREADEVNGVAVRDGLAYVATGETGLVILDLARADSPVVLASLDTPGQALNVALAGTTALVADFEGGLVVADVSDPRNPRFLGKPEAVPCANDVAAAGKFALVAASFDGLVVVDIANPAEPRRVGGKKLRGECVAVATAGRLAFAATLAHGLQVVDIDNPGWPRWLALAGGRRQDGWAFDCAVMGGLVATASGKRGLLVYDTSRPSHPVLRASWDAPFLGGPGFGAISVAAGDRVWFLACDDDGVAVVAAEEGESPQQIGRIQTPGRARAVVPASGRLLIADGTALVIAAE